MDKVGSATSSAADTVDMMNMMALRSPGVASAMHRVLVIEDDEQVGREIVAALEDYRFEVEIETTGHQGLLKAVSGQFDVLVLDRMLPDLDGLSILATLRNVGRMMPVLILSALSTVDERVRGLRSGGDDYLVKPFDGLELAARLNALLRRRREMMGSEANDASLLRVDDLLIDTQRHLVVRDGQVLDLKPKEYSLLEYLVRHEGEVVTRTMLLEAIWNYHFNNYPHGTQSNVIDMHISNLRRKLSLGGRLGPMITTVRNTGYTIHAQN